jgi:SAM-dependent methyltransferase
MELSAVIRDLNENPHRERSFYEYPELYEFFQSRVVDRDAHVGLVERFEPNGANRVLEFGCGTGPLLARIEDEYDEVLGVDTNESMLELAEQRVTDAELRNADFTEWSAAAEGRAFDVVVLMGGLLHLTEDHTLDRFAENVHGSLCDGGVFVTFFAPFSDAIENGSREVDCVESERYSVDRHATSALTSSAGHYTTTYLFVIRDRERGKTARMGTVFHGRFFTRERLTAAFADAGFEAADVLDRDGPTIFHATR